MSFAKFCDEFEEHQFMSCSVNAIDRMPLARHYFLRREALIAKKGATTQIGAFAEDVP